MNRGSFLGKQKANRRPFMIGRVLLGGVGALISIGLAAPASADPVTTVGSVGAPQPDAVQSFFGAARAAGITGTDPAMLEDGYAVCRQLWNPQTPATQVAANLVRDNPQLTSDQAGNSCGPRIAPCARWPPRTTTGRTAPADSGGSQGFTSMLRRRQRKSHCCPARTTPITPRLVVSSSCWQWAACTSGRIRPRTE